MPKFICTVLLLVCLPFYSCSAEHFNADFYQISVSDLSKYQKKIFDYLEFERVDLERSYSQPSDFAWLSFARLYEEYTKIICFSGSVDPRFEEPRFSPKRSKNCNFVLGKLEKYAPDHLFLKCFSTGFATETCSEAFQGQYITEYQDSIESQTRITQLEDKINAARAQQFSYDQSELLTIYQNLLSLYRRNPAKFDIRDLEVVLAANINGSCFSDHVIYASQKPDDFMLGKNLVQQQRYNNDQLYQDVYKLLHDPSRYGNTVGSQGQNIQKEAKAAEEQANANRRDPFEKGSKKVDYNFTPMKHWRIRMLTPECFEWVLEGLKFNPVFPAAICNLHGKFSPFCQESYLRYVSPGQSVEAIKKKSYKLQKF